MRYIVTLVSSWIFLIFKICYNILCLWSTAVWSLEYKKATTCVTRRKIDQRNPEDGYKNRALLDKTGIYKLYLGFDKVLKLTYPLLLGCCSWEYFSCEASQLRAQLIFLKPKYNKYPSLSLERVLYSLW